MPAPVATAAPAAAPAAPTNGAAKGAPQQPVAKPVTPVTKPGAPAQAASEGDADPIIWEGKVNGQSRQVRKSEADRYLSKGAHADATTQAAKEAIRAAQKAQQEYEARERARQERAKTNTDEVLRELGIDPDEFARSRLEKRVAEGKMTPEEKRAAEAEARAKELENKLAEQSKREESERQQQLASQLEKNIQGQLMASVKRAGMETGPDTLYALHQTMDEMMGLGLLPMDGVGLPAHVADQIVEDARARISEAQSRLEKAVLAGLKGEALKARLGGVVYKEVLAHALEEVRSRRPGYVKPVNGAPAPAPAAPAPRPTGYIKPAQFDAKIHELKEKHQ